MEAQKTNAPKMNNEEIARWVSNAEQNGECEHYAGKRSATRFVDGMSLQVALNPAVPSGYGHVYMQNVSESGFAFWSKKEILPRTTLYVRDGSAEGEVDWIEARVTHCTRGIRGFLIGASFGPAPQK